MSYSYLALILITVILIAYLIGKYQQSNGYSFYKAFIGAIIGLIGLSLLAIKAFG